MVQKVASVTLAVGLVPVTVVAAVQLAGFSSAGIVAGSVAASMMSSAAIAAGGGIASGSAVATFQSIGAIGFSAALPIAGIVLATLSVGALIGVGIYYVFRSFYDAPRVCGSAVRIAIKAPNGRYLIALGGGQGNWFFDAFKHKFYTGVVKAEATRVDLWETYTVRAAGGDYFTLQSHHGAYLSVNACDRDVRANCNGEEAEKFRFRLTSASANDALVWYGYFQTESGDFLTINHQHCHFCANAKSIDAAAYFEVLGK